MGTFGDGPLLPEKRPGDDPWLDAAHADIANELADLHAEDVRAIISGKALSKEKQQRLRVLEQRRKDIVAEKVQRKFQASDGKK